MADQTKTKTGKKVTEMSSSELGMYRHGPETELSALVCQISENELYNDLRDYLQMLVDTDPKKLKEADSAGMTALHFAVSCKNLKIVKMLVHFGAKGLVNQQDYLGFTPLFLATGRYKSVEIAQFLLEEGKADINLRTKTLTTPLHGAALEGNIDCIKLLVAHGADPRVVDENGTTPFELSKDDDTRSALHDAQIENDSKKDLSDVVCAWCKEVPKDGGKRCGQCFVTFYCGRMCQVNDWRKGNHRNLCPGSVVASSFHCDEKKGQGLQTSFYRVMSSLSPNVKVFMRNTADAVSKMKFLENKRFVVKVQLPLGMGADAEMMVYNVDRTVQGFVYKDAKGYDELARRIRSEGIMGLKAFFWAKVVVISNEGEFRIFHGKCAPPQSW